MPTRNTAIELLSHGAGGQSRMMQSPRTGLRMCRGDGYGSSLVV